MNDITINNSTKSRLVIPCLRGAMGDWVYYTALMKFSSIAERIKTADEIHKSKGLQTLLQRSLTDRSKSIADYLINQKQHFFNALVVGIYDGDPSWYEIAVDYNPAVNIEEINNNVRGSVGVLVLNGNENIFAIDGQHRLIGIGKAIQEDRQLNDDEQTVIFVAHRTSLDGIKRTRRLFSTLNRYAKPVSLPEIIALDEDDPIAIITRRLLEDNILLKRSGAVWLKNQKAVPSKEKVCFTSLHALYEFVDIILLGFMNSRKRKPLKAFRPDDNQIDKYFERIDSVVCQMAHTVTVLQHYTVDQSDLPASQYRTENGGHLLFRPVGLHAFAEAFRMLTESGNDERIVISTLSKLPLNLAELPWRGVLWEALNKEMITRKKNQSLAARLMVYYSHLPCDHKKYKKDRLAKDYASAINQDLSELPSINNATHEY